MGEFLKRLLILPPIILAVLGFIWLQNRPEPEPVIYPEAAIAVRVMTAEPQPLSLEATGFGRVAAARSWSAVAEVEGRLTQYDEALQVGTIVDAGELLFQIDTRDYEIAVAQSQADLLGAEAALEELNVNAANTEASLAVEREILDLYQQDRDRTAELVQRGNIAQSQLDADNRTLLAQQSAVTGLETTLALVDPQRITAEATLASARANLESAERDLARTSVAAPFQGRITERGASGQQYVRTGDVLFRIEDISASEVEAAFQLADLRVLISSFSAAQIAAQLGPGASAEELEQALGQSFTAEVVSQLSNGESFRWPATLVRSNGTIDNETGALGLVVRVDDPTAVNLSTTRPPLATGSFVEVVISAPVTQDVIILPREALRSDDAGAYVFGLDDDDRLTRIDLITGPIVGNDIIIEEGLAGGDRVVLSDPSPAVIGALTAPVFVDDGA